MGSPGEFGVVRVPPAAAPFLSMVNSSHANISLPEFLLLYRGPKHLPPQVVIPITIIYLLIFISGVIGNSLVCMVIWRNKSMQTATNFYLFSLAVSDLTLLLLGLPNDLSVFWQQYPWGFGNVVCKLRTLASETSSYSSVLVIVAFSAERYLAVCHPFHTLQISTLRRARRVIALSWALSLLCAAPFAIYTDVHYLDFPPGSKNYVQESAFCSLLMEKIPASLPVYDASSVLFFLIPLLVIAFMYFKIYMKLRQREGSSLRPPSNSRRAIIRMLGAVVIAFFLCWAPFHLQRLVYVHMNESPHYQLVNEYLYYVTGCFYFFSSTVNPLLYSVMSGKFRAAFKSTLCCGEADIRRTESIRASGGGTLLRNRFHESRRASSTTVRLADPNGNTAVTLNEIAPDLRSLKNSQKETYI